MNHKIVNNSIYIERIGMNNKPEIKKYIPRRAADGIWVHVYRFIDKISNITNRIFLELNHNEITVTKYILTVELSLNLNQTYPNNESFVFKPSVFQLALSNSQRNRGG